MIVLYTKYKAESNALRTIYVKFGLKMYWRVWKFEFGKYRILKWKMCRNPEKCLNAYFSRVKTRTVILINPFCSGWEHRWTSVQAASRFVLGQRHQRTLGHQSHRHTAGGWGTLDIRPELLHAENNGRIIHTQPRFWLSEYWYVRLLKETAVLFIRSDKFQLYLLDVF